MSNDPQYNLRTVLKPYLGFEAVYQGQSIAYSINLSPVGLPALDPKAGQPGYDSRLPRAFPVPKGARVTLWLPLLFSVQSAVTYPYIYRLTWRLRSIVDYASERKPYHIPDQRLGVPNSFSLPAPRYALPAASQGIVYNQTQPATTGTTVVQRLIIEEFAVQGNRTVFFLNPDGQLSGPQQGVDTPTGLTPPVEMAPQWVTYDCHALGDEVFVSVRRNNDDAASPNWDFSGGAPEPDALFSNFYGEGEQVGGYPDQGVYIMPGVAP